MEIAGISTNFEKHTSNNPLQKFLIGNFYRRLIGLLKPLSVKTVLDAGCGEGVTLNKLVDNHIGKNLEGIESSDIAISLSRKVNPSLNIKRGNVYNLPYKDNSFDLVVSTEVLEHLDDPGKALHELIRVSNKYLLLTVPNEPLFTIQRVLRGKNLMHFGFHPEHIQHWTPGAFKNFLKQNKLKILSVRLPFAWTMILAGK